MDNICYNAMGDITFKFNIFYIFSKVNHYNSDFCLQNYCGLRRQQRVSDLLLSDFLNKFNKYNGP